MKAACFRILAFLAAPVAFADAVCTLSGPVSPSGIENIRTSAETLEQAESEALFQCAARYQRHFPDHSSRLAWCSAHITCTETILETKQD